MAFAAANGFPVQTGMIFQRLTAAFPSFGHLQTLDANGREKIPDRRESLKMKIAAYLAPLLENGSLAAFDLLRTQVAVCEEAGVEMLCFPEAVLGGLAGYYDRPSAYALNVKMVNSRSFCRL